MDPKGIFILTYFFKMTDGYFCYNYGAVNETKAKRLNMSAFCKNCSSR
jgi:hypothetical protein